MKDATSNVASSHTDSFSYIVCAQLKAYTFKNVCGKPILSSYICFALLEDAAAAETGAIEKQIAESHGDHACLALEAGAMVREDFAKADSKDSCICKDLYCVFASHLHAAATNFLWHVIWALASPCDLILN